MKTYGSARYETLKEAGYVHVGYNRNTGEHILKDIETAKLEIWCANKNHAGYGLIYKNTHLEFASGTEAKVR